MTNENLALYQDAYEIGAEKIIEPTRKRLAMSIRGCR
ncbi:ribonucleoside-diphosphate reductase 2 alpha chain [Escherichia coli]|uniref:Ribonucleoside-diphosphate reductase 2 alpha chain n=1 Tax=Escherichia coli TaxID=562 RepID=A0A377DMZ3_ECOLX|nr:ribonucleoside-diphosphate reductase 2 alpha chain [Escherichia coli]